MRESRILFMVAFAAAALVLSCSMGPVESISDGTDYPNTKTVSGVLVGSDGSGVAGTQVQIVKSDYNPQSGEVIADSCYDTTDNFGRYSLAVTESGNHTYNLYARHLTTAKQCLIRDVSVAKDTVLDTALLSDPGALYVVLPDTVDTARGYVYFEGTPLCCALSYGKYFTGNHYVVFFDSVPPGHLPPLKYAIKIQQTTLLLVSDNVDIIAKDTILVGTDESNLKPIWRLSFIIGVPEKTVSYFSTLDSIQKLIRDQIKRVEKKFNDPGVLKGVVEFCIDSLYQFSTPVADELVKPLDTGFDYRLIYDGFSDQNVGNYNKSNNTLFQAWKAASTSGLFGSLSLDVLTWIFGASRGCVAINWTTVKAESNPINGQAYNGVTSIMNYPYGVDEWDEYNVHVLNYQADKAYDGHNLIHKIFPASMGVIARSALGIPLDNATITLYGVPWYNKTVNAIPILTGITDSAGEFVFPVNPFKPDTVESAIYSNILVSAVHQSDTAYAWCPINEVGIAWFRNPQSDFRINVGFDKVTGSAGKK